jgi:hypothetical protein
VRTRALIAVAVVVVLGCLGWAAHEGWRNRQVREGVVVNQRHVPAHNETRLVYNITLKTSLPQQFHVPDRWSVCIHSHDRTGTERQVWWRVSREVYEATEIGDRMSLQGD